MDLLLSTQSNSSNLLHFFQFVCIASFRVILPLFKKHSPKIDQAIEKAGNKAGDLFDQAMEKAKDYAAEQQLKKD